MRKTKSKGTKNCEVIKMKHSEKTPMYDAVSRCIQNLMATYGEKQVEQSIEGFLVMKSSVKVWKSDLKEHQEVANEKRR